MEEKGYIETDIHELTVKTRKIGNVELYKLNEESSLVKAIDNFNNKLIDIITEEEIEKLERKEKILVRKLKIKFWSHWTEGV